MNWKRATYQTFNPQPKPERKLPEKKKAVSKTPTTTYGQLKKQADEVFSEYIRQYYADSKGFVKCITCPTTLHWKQMHNGHFVNRDQNIVRYDFRNNNPQCPECNVVKRGNIEVYEIEIDKLHGKGTARTLRELAPKPFKLDREHLVQIIDNYRIIKRA